MGVALEPSLPRSSPVMKRPYSFHSLVIGNIAVLLVAVAKVDTTRDAFVVIGTFMEDVDGTVTSTRDAFIIVAPLKDMVHLVTELVETYVQPF